MLFLIVGRASAQEACSVAYDNSDLFIQCGPSDDVIEVYVTVLASGGSLVRTLFVDIGDGQGPVNQGPATDLDVLAIDTADGSDKVTIHDIDANIGLAVTTGAGPDKVTVGPNVGVDELFSINTGVGGDEIVLGLDVQASTGSIEVRAGAGSDIVSTVAAPSMEIPGVLAIGDIKIFGGGGTLAIETDTIYIGQDSLFANGRVLIGGFEGFGGAFVPSD